MADKRAAKAFLGEIGRFKRQQNHQVVEESSDFLRAFRTPGPNRRRNIMDKGNAGTLQLLRDAERKVRRVDGDKGRRAQTQDFVDGFADALQNVGDMLRQFKDAEMRQFGLRKERLQPFFQHARAADAGKTHAAFAFLLQRMHQPGAEQIARSLASNQEEQGRFFAHTFLPTMKIPAPTAMAMAFSRSTKKLRPASITMPRTPAPAAAKTVLGPMVGKS